MLSDHKRITIICSDIVSAIYEKNLLKIENYIPITTYVGKLAKYLTSLKTDNIKKKVVSRKYLCELAIVNGISVIDENTHIRELKKLNVISEVNDFFKVQIEAIEDVYVKCGRYWLKKVSEDSYLDDFYFVNIYYRLYRPTKSKDIKREFKEYKSLGEALKILSYLNLIVYIKDLDVYYSPKFFKSEVEDVANFVGRIDKISDDFLNLLEAINEKQAYPMANVPGSLKKATEVAYKTGLLEPIEVTVGNQSEIFLFIPDGSDDKLYLSKETAAHFRYNEIFAHRKWGILDDSAVFLDRLVNRGHAGKATNIGYNYQPLELKGVLVTKKAGLTGRYYMIYRQGDVLKHAITYLEERIEAPKALKIGDRSDWFKDPIESLASAVYEKDFYKTKKMNFLKTVRDEAR